MKILAEGQLHVLRLRSKRKGGGDQVTNGGEEAQEGGVVTRQRGDEGPHVLK